jgi:HEAT repeat protein
VQDLDTIYEAIATGTESAPMSMARGLQTLARERARGTVADKLGALRVATALGTDHGMPILLELSSDSAIEVRRNVLDLTLGHGWRGLPVLRRMIGDADEDLAVNALELLIRAADQPAAAGARRLLRDPRSRVRVAAATLLGLVGGPGMQIDLRRLESDTDDAVREAVDEAIRRIRGESPQPGPDPWWEVEDDIAPLIPAEEVPETASLPPEMPIEARALTRLLGSVGTDDRAVVAAHLERCDPGSISVLPGQYKPGGDPVFSRGIALASALLPRSGWLSTVRRISRDPDPRVRAAAAMGIGAIGGTGTIIELGKLCSDEEDGVRIAAVAAMASLCMRVERPDLGRRYIEPLVDDDAVGDAAKSALAGLD